jgi:putative ABC transport system substrate-binding protein
MRRRQFITLLGGTAASSILWPRPRAARAQQPERMRRIGVLNTIVDGQPRIAHFQRGLRDLGYVEGRNIVLERRTAAGQYDRLDTLAAELVALKVDALLAVTQPAALASQRATTTIPIVFALVSDPVGAKLVNTIPRPGGNISGITSGFQYTTAKRFEMFKKAVGFSRVAVLTNPSEPIVTRRTIEESETASATLETRIHPIAARLPEDLPRAFSEIAEAGINAVLVAADAMFYQERARIAELALRHRIASMFALREHGDAGGLMSYGPSYDAPFYRAAAFVDKILKGENPADLPVEQPTKLDFLINLKTAKALGLEIPPMLLALTDEVIE